MVCENSTFIGWARIFSAGTEVDNKEFTMLTLLKQLRVQCGLILGERQKFKMDKMFSRSKLASG